ncbi:MAG: long-chain-acyl-CoA synthetase [Proteobacteria bacterium]|nr:long-chain-acyl-CoA synthetase [Pseudomonadota bacterium]
MGLLERIAREGRYLRGVCGTLNAVRTISSDSPNLVCDDWERAVDRHGPRTALSMDGRSLSYAQADALANRVAHWARAQGLQRGEAVALVLPNRLDYVPLWLGLAKAGVVAALVNCNLQGAALCHCISVGGARHVIADADTAPAVAAVRGRLAQPVTLWTLDGAAGDADLQAALDNAPDRRPDPAIRAGMTAGDAAMYIYTSGTTGLPKAAKVTHVRAQMYLRSFAGALRATREDRVFVVLPLYHSTGGLVGVGAALMAGGAAVLRKRFSASSFWEDVEAEGATLFVYVGELCRYMVNQPERPVERAHKLRAAFGNGLRPEVWRRFQARFAIPEVLEFYGATEGNVSVVNFDGRPGSIGRVAPYLRFKFNVRLVRFDPELELPIRGPDGFCIACTPGEVGEALGEIGPAARTQYVGYAEPGGAGGESERKILKDAFKAGDRWFRTGDLMRQDRDGYLYFVDRIGDTFRWKGENVSTGEVAEALLAAPGVQEANVYGVEVPGAEGRAGMAALVVGPGFDPKGLARHLDAELPGCARPLFLRIQPAIETTGTFKYRKAELVADGFDPSRVPDPVLFKDAGAGYVPLDAGLYARIVSGEIRV